MNLNSYNWIVISTSAGKDSQVMLDDVVDLARAQNCKNRIVAVHADLGRVEWKGTKDLAERQAKHYGLRFEVVKRPQGDLLEHIEKRGMFPSSAARYCTSDHKRGQFERIYTMLANEHHGNKRGQVAAPCMILNCMGFRAEESPARAKRKAFENNKRATNGRRHVDNWLPIHTWKQADVWKRINQSRVEHHYAYDLGMPRLSCVFCIFAPRDALLIAGQHNRELLDKYCDVEKRINHTFRKDFPISEIRDALDSGEVGNSEKCSGGCWNM